jgi:alkaline phosphatase D
MKYFSLLLVITSFISCGEPTEHNSEEENKDLTSPSYDYRMVFASCNDQDREQPLWKPIIENTPDLFVWGGDNVYADTDDMAKMKADYDKVWANSDYKTLTEQTTITGTWDDHDFGKNDAGVEWEHKEAAKDLLLDFLKVPENDVRRTREGVYTSEMYKTPKGSIKLILLDTRTFRDSLHKSEDPNLRYDAWEGSEGGTILGAAQWNWLEEELQDDSANFTLIVTSIQFLNDQHGWEKWGNHPSEVDKMKEVLVAAKAKNIALLSGDRHMAEISVADIEGLNYPLIDFTSSGLTHTWVDGATEGNPFRISNVIKRLNFGVLLFNFEKNQITFELRGKDNFLYEQHLQQY